MASEIVSLLAMQPKEAPPPAFTLPDVSDSYKKLIAYKTENYYRQSAADFNAALAPTPHEANEFIFEQSRVASFISPDDENYDFITTTLEFSYNELYCRSMGEEFVFFADILKQGGLCDYFDDAGEIAIYWHAYYSIDSPKLVTIGERDKILLTFKEEMQNYLDGLSKAEIADGYFSYLNNLNRAETADGNLRKMLMDKSAEIADSLSTENMKLLPCEIARIGIN